MKNLKIALLGKMRSGKDTVADILVNEYGLKKYAFGDAIGDIIENYFPTAWDNGKPRKHYQVIGQCFRTLDHDVWVKKLLSNIKRDSIENVVISDTRQANEVNALKHEGYIIIKIVSNDDERINRIKAQGDIVTVEAFEHETEIGVDNVPHDYEIVNNKTLKDLEMEVKNIINKILNEK